MERRHVVEGEARCERQRLLIGRMTEQGNDTGEANRLLENMEDALRLSRERVQHLCAEPKAHYETQPTPERPRN